MAHAEYMSKDRVWQEEKTIYWFELSGIDYGTGFKFSGEVYGVAESGEEVELLNSDGWPMTESDHETIAAWTAIVPKMGGAREA